MSAGWIEICWSSGFVGPVDYTKSVMWVDFRWVDYSAGGSRSVGPVDCRSGGLRFVATVDSERPSPRAGHGCRAGATLLE